MKKVTILMIALVFTTSLVLVSCGGGGNSPSKTVKKGMNLFYDKQYDDAVVLFAKKDGTKLTEEEATKLVGLMAMGMEQEEEKEGMKDIEIIEETISEDGNTATVKYKIFFNNGDEKESEGRLIKIDGDWYMLISG